MKWHVWLTFIVGTALLGGLVFKIMYTSHAVEAEECEVKVIDRPVGTVIERVVTTTESVPIYYQDPALKEKLISCMSENDELRGEIAGYKTSIEDLKNRCSL